VRCVAYCACVMLVFHTEKPEANSSKSAGGIIAAHRVDLKALTVDLRPEDAHKWVWEKRGREYVCHGIGTLPDAEASPASPLKTRGKPSLSAAHSSPSRPDLNMDDLASAVGLPRGVASAASETAVSAHEGADDVLAMQPFPTLQPPAAVVPSQASSTAVGSELAQSFRATALAQLRTLADSYGAVAASLNTHKGTTLPTSTAHWLKEAASALDEVVPDRGRADAGVDLTFPSANAAAVAPVQSPATAEAATPTPLGNALAAASQGAAASSSGAASCFSPSIDWAAMDVGTVLPSASGSGKAPQQAAGAKRPRDSVASEASSLSEADAGMLRGFLSLLPPQKQSPAPGASSRKT